MDEVKPRFSLKKKEINKKALLITLGLSLILIVLSVIIQYFSSEGLLSYLGGFPAYFDPDGVYWEAVNDAKNYYEPYLYEFRYVGWDLYAPGQEYPLRGYYYGPFYVYFLAFISLFVSMFNPTAPATLVVSSTIRIAPLVFDALSAVMIFLILKYHLNKNQRTHKRTIIAFLSGLCYNLMPMVIVYNSAFHLNSYMVAFFTLVALYFFTRRRIATAGALLALAFLIKQICLFFLPVWFLILFRENIENSFKFLFSFILAMLLLSLPWIFQHPIYYIGALLGTGSSAIPKFTLTYFKFSVTFSQALIYLGSRSLALAYFLLNKYYVPFIVFSLVFYRIAMLKGDHLWENRNSFFTYNAIYMMGIFLFISRGIYKNYDTFLFPFILLAIGEWVLRLKKGYFRYSLFAFSIAWVIGTSILIIWATKWLHIPLLLVIWIPLFFTYNRSMNLALFQKENYSNFHQYIKKIFHLEKTKNE